MSATGKLLLTLDEYEKQAALIAMKHVKPSDGIYHRLIENWRLIEPLLQKGDILEKLLEGLQAMSTKIPVKSKMKEAFLSLIRSVKKGEDPTTKPCEGIDK